MSKRHKKKDSRKPSLEKIVLATALTNLITALIKLIERLIE